MSSFELNQEREIFHVHSDNHKGLSSTSYEQNLEYFSAIVLMPIQLYPCNSPYRPVTL
jgi:hypothetical protein